LCDENTSPNQSCRLDPQVYDEFKEDFEDMDYDGDLKINQKELGKYMASLGSDYTGDDEGN